MGHYHNSEKLMKRQHLFAYFVIIALTNSLYCQHPVWWTFDLEGIEIDFPFEEVSQKDTVIKDVPIKMLYCNYENSVLILQKQFDGNNFSEFPHNRETLNEYHDEVIEGMKNVYNNEVKRNEINHLNFIGAKATFIEDSNPFNESNIFLVENQIIIATYHSFEPFDTEIKEQFLSSLNFGDLAPSTQMIGESKAYRQGVLFGKIAFYGILGIGAFFVIRSLRKK